MLERLRPVLLRAFRVPPDPATPAGEAVRVFRASRNLYRYHLARWALRQAGALLGLLAGFAFLRALEVQGDVPSGVLFVVRAVEVLAAAAFVAQLPVTYAMLRLDFELRWYIVGERSLRIREGLFHVREQTMTFANVQNLSIRQGPLQRLLGIADLEVHTAGGGGSAAAAGHEGAAGSSMHVGVFRGVDDPERIRDVVRDRVRQSRGAGLGDPDDDDGHHDEAPALPSAAGEAPALAAAREVLAQARALRGAWQAR